MCHGSSSFCLISRAGFLGGNRAEVVRGGHGRSLGRGSVSAATQYRMQLGAGCPTRSGCEGCEDVISTDAWVPVEATDAVTWETWETCCGGEDAPDALDAPQGAGGRGRHVGIETYAGKRDSPTGSGPAVYWASNADRGVQGNESGADAARGHGQAWVAEVSVTHPYLALLDRRPAEASWAVALHQKTGWGCVGACSGLVNTAHGGERENLGVREGLSLAVKNHALGPSGLEKDAARDVERYP
ncbi:hypothetical protein VTI74DRAFT_6157 [Chaetomium olivicolor]